jgi:site-specific DNA-methyltransferase (adenine-specific)
MSYNINHADIYEWAKNYTGEPFDAVLCDPPYELGFMGKSWDSTGIAFNKDMWKAVFNILKPGGHLLAFSGSRTYHRMACAIEDAGFEIRDMIEWIYGSGFPKSLNVGMAVDKALGNDREVTGTTKANGMKAITKSRVEQGYRKNLTIANSRDERPTTKGTSPYEGYGTALKPAHEPCVLARKPIEGTVANNVLKHGTGGLNIDESRVGKQQGDRTEYGVNGIKRKTGNVWGKQYGEIEFDGTQGRFPANLIHDGSDEVVGLFPNSKSAGEYHKDKLNTFKPDKAMFALGYQTNAYAGESGSAARFFYTAKASKSERNAGLDRFEPKRESDRIKDDGVGGDNPRNRSNNARANHHPTVKPLSLTKYLANLIKPPTGGRLLVPFSGSGSEMIGALQAGWEHVEGVELTEEYIPIAEARIKYWVSKVEEETIQTRLI